MLSSTSSQLLPTFCVKDNNMVSVKEVTPRSADTLKSNCAAVLQTWWDRWYNLMYILHSRDNTVSHWVGSRFSLNFHEILCSNYESEWLILRFLLPVGLNFNFKMMQTVKDTKFQQFWQSNISYSYSINVSRVSLKALFGDVWSSHEMYYKHHDFKHDALSYIQVHEVFEMCSTLNICSNYINHTV